MIILSLFIVSCGPKTDQVTQEISPITRLHFGRTSELTYKKVKIEGKIYLCSRSSNQYWIIGPEVKE